MGLSHGSALRSSWTPQCAVRSALQHSLLCRNGLIDTSSVISRNNPHPPPSQQTPLFYSFFPDIKMSWNARKWAKWWFWDFEIFSRNPPPCFAPFENKGGFVAWDHTDTSPVNSVAYVLYLRMFWEPDSGEGLAKIIVNHTSFKFQLPVQKVFPKCLH